MAKRRVSGNRPAQHARPKTPAKAKSQAPAERRNPPLFNLKPEPVTEERREILATIPAWARTLRVRSGFVIGAAMIVAIVAYNAGGRVAGPAIAGGVMVAAALAMWRADKLEARARTRAEGGG